MSSFPLPDNPNITNAAETIEREYGSGAAVIAARVADRLVWTLWDQLLTEEIARLAHCNQSAVEKREERRDPLYCRLLKSFARGSYEGSRGAPIAMLDADSIVRISQQVVGRAASAGNCVIVGRGSQHFLRDREDTLRFFLYASKQGKLRRLVSEGYSQADAEQLVDTVDRERAAFIGPLGLYPYGISLLDVIRASGTSVPSPPKLDSGPLTMVDQTIEGVSYSPGKTGTDLAPCGRAGCGVDCARIVEFRWQISNRADDPTHASHATSSKRRQGAHVRDEIESVAALGKNLRGLWRRGCEESLLQIVCCRAFQREHGTGGADRSRKA